MAHGRVIEAGPGPQHPQGDERDDERDGRAPGEEAEGQRQIASFTDTVGPGGRGTDHRHRRPRPTRARRERRTGSERRSGDHRGTIGTGAPGRLWAWTPPTASTPCGSRAAAAARAAQDRLDVAVPHLDWTVGEVLGHLGGVHRRFTACLNGVDRVAGPRDRDGTVRRPRRLVPSRPGRPGHRARRGSASTTDSSPGPAPGTGTGCSAGSPTRPPCTAGTSRPPAVHPTTSIPSRPSRSSRSSSPTSSTTGAFPGSTTWPPATVRPCTCTPPTPTPVSGS